MIFFWLQRSWLHLDSSYCLLPNRLGSLWIGLLLCFLWLLYKFLVLFGWWFKPSTTGVLRCNRQKQEIFYLKWQRNLCIFLGDNRYIVVNLFLSSINTRIACIFSNSCLGCSLHLTIFFQNISSSHMTSAIRMCVKRCVF